MDFGEILTRIIRVGGRYADHWTLTVALHDLGFAELSWVEKLGKTFWAFLRRTLPKENHQFRLPLKTFEPSSF